MLSLQSGFFYSDFLTKIVCALLVYQCNMARTPHQHGLGHHYIWREIRRKKIDFQLYNFYFPFSLPNIRTFYCTTFPYIPSIYFPLSWRHAKFHTNMKYEVQI